MLKLGEAKCVRTAFYRVAVIFITEVEKPVSISGLKFEEFVRILLELIMKINLFKLYFRNFLFEV
jgi:hypothetical protein